RNLDAIHRAFPDKPIVISEYGYCACTPDRPEDDSKRVDVLVGHDRVFRDADYVAGLIFFDYNDYRTHVGDKGVRACKQRVHGVVDVFGSRDRGSSMEEPASQQSIYRLQSIDNQFSYSFSYSCVLAALAPGPTQYPEEGRSKAKRASPTFPAADVPRIPAEETGAADPAELLLVHQASDASPGSALAVVPSDCDFPAGVDAG